MLTSFNEKLHMFIWGPGMLFFFCGCGVFLTIGTGFFQIKHMHTWVKSTLGSLLDKNITHGKQDEHSTSAFQTFTSALAGTLGTGNIVGVGTALAAGGPGAIFWMWISAIFGMMTGYGENVLGYLYRRRNKCGQWQGGPMYYLQYGLKSKWLAVIFAVFATLASYGMGNMAQSNSIAHALQSNFNLPPIVTGIVVGIIIAIVITGGITRIGNVTEKLIPIMATVYIMGCFIILIKFAHNIPDAFYDIVKSAFSTRSIVGGVGGYSVLSAMRFGIARGVFSNEAGLGSSVLIHSSNSVKEPAVQGMWNICEIFIDTIIMCTLTALCILVTGAFETSTNGALLASKAFELGFGNIGGVFLSVAITLFAFSTLLSWSYNGSLAMEYLFGTKSRKIYTILFVFIIPFGCTLQLDIVWSISDTCNGLMAVPNLIGIILLSGKIFNVTRVYLANKSNM